MEADIEGLLVLITNLKLKNFELWFINREERSLEFLGEKLGLSLPQDVGGVDPSSIGGKKGIFITITFEVLINPNGSNIEGFFYWS